MSDMKNDFSQLTNILLHLNSEQVRNFHRCSPGRVSIVKNKKAKVILHSSQDQKFERFNETLLKYAKHRPQGGKENRTTMSVS